MTGIYVIVGLWAAAITGAELFVKPWKRDETRADRLTDTALIALYGLWLFPYLVARWVKGKTTP